MEYLGERGGKMEVNAMRGKGRIEGGGKGGGGETS